MIYFFFFFLFLANPQSADPLFDYQKIEPIILCDLVKLFLRDLPQPLIPFQFYDELLQIFKDNRTTPPKMISLLNTCFNKMPRPNKALLIRLIKFWAKVAANQSVNKMTAENLAVCFCPNIMYRQGDQMMKMVEEYPLVTEMWTILISNYERVRLLV